MDVAVGLEPMAPCRSVSVHWVVFFFLSFFASSYAVVLLLILKTM